MKNKQDRLVVAEDRKTAILDKTIHLKAVETINGDLYCKGCYLQRKDGRCREAVESLSSQGTRCTHPHIIWVAVSVEDTKEYSEIEDFLSLVYRVLTICGAEEAKALLLQVSEKGFTYDKELCGCFVFDKTAQGHDYWLNISEKLGEIT